MFDGVEDRITLVVPVRPAAGIDAAAAYTTATQRIRDVIEGLEQPLPPTASALSSGAPTEALEATANMSSDTFKANVLKAREYVHAGDAFQIVPSQRFSVPFELPPFALYRALRRLNPSPFLFFFNLAGFSIVGSSPEILVRVRDGRVTIRPLAGTRRRGKTEAEDRALAEELRNDPKELAEHLMLLDLARNDVGRVAKIGSVEVLAQFEVEYYSHVMHLSSTRIPIPMRNIRKASTKPPPSSKPPARRCSSRRSEGGVMPQHRLFPGRSADPGPLSSFEPLPCSQAASGPGSRLRLGRETALSGARG